MFLSLSQYPGRLTCCLVLVCVVAFSARFAVFLDAVAFGIRWRVGMPGFVLGDGMGWGGGVVWGGGVGLGGVGGDDNVLV